ncbi:MAG: glycosyltransferase, partial [Verrucomicrobiota bacterium]
MRVVLTSHGSTGDIYPMIAFGHALLQAGHEVKFATAPLYRQSIQDAGLDYIHLPPDWEKEIFIEFMRELNRAPL